MTDQKPTGDQTDQSTQESCTNEKSPAPARNPSSTNSQKGIVTKRGMPWISGIFALLISGGVLVWGLQLAAENGRLQGELKVANKTNKHLSDEREADRWEHKRELAAVQNEIKRLRSLHPLLQRYGGDFHLYKSWEIGDPGAQPGLIVGNCGNYPCLQIQITSVDLDPKAPLLHLGLSGASFASGQPNVLGIPIPLRTGCYIEAITDTDDFRFLIEDSRIESLRAGIVLKPGTLGEPGLLMNSGQCPDEES